MEHSEPHEYGVPAGEHISKACQDIASLAAAWAHPIFMVFNGVRVVATPGSDPKALEAEWGAEMDARREAYLASAEGQAFEQERKRRRHRADEAAAQAFATFSIVDKQAWDTYADNTSDLYVQAILRYAARWAAAMEREMAAGKQLDDIAERTGHEADLEGISGLMASIATTVLVRVWEHGSALSEWQERRLRGTKLYDQEPE